ncbi:hypothetical protein [Pseudodesulfovibrio senegalensis]|jgi:hypothetical protein|uniref:Uncharacterized protein n=1 Tax=Pseudodesulfovibrio senegalensis TaxID=1721087 RepID=A0A6N6N0X1_9BACT|nr:hypothetical protein [Pseudodesulfovibrio senegalensis]KAB1440893.1 hypothetical protein F8A88_13185 [Pseudodesulfovibrio senegalensis]
MVCIHLDMAVGLVLVVAVFTAFRFLRPRSPNAEMLAEALQRMESGPKTGTRQKAAHRPDHDRSFCLPGTPEKA